MNQEKNNVLLRVMTTISHRGLNLTNHQLMAFLLVCKNEGVSASDVQNQASLPKATASRILRTLADKDGPHKEGYGLIELRHDDMDYRVRRAYLTDKGKSLIQELHLAL